MLWKDFLFFSKSQQNGIRVLIVILICMIFFPLVYRRMVPLPPTDFSAFEESLRTYRKQIATRQEEEANSPTPAAQTHAPEKAAEPVLNPGPFDPNDLSVEAWVDMGIPAYVANSIRNYMEAGGTFRYREDLRRIYLMKEQWYVQLEPHIQLPPKPSSVLKDAEGAIAADRVRGRDSARTAGSDLAKTGDDITSETKSSPGKIRGYETRALSIDINQADTVRLMEINGIGPVFSKRIFGYRELLGGYHQPEQLLEVYGMDSVRWLQICPHLVFDTLHIRKINLNQAAFKDLIRHPYIDRNLANSLLGIRDQHGPLSSIMAIRQSYLVDEQVYEKISPYIKVE